MAKINIDLSTVTLSELDAFYADARKLVRVNGATVGAAKIKECTDRAYAALAEAEEIANEYCITFTFSVDYGMGGTYYPSNTDNEDWDESNEGWVSSSSSC